MADYRVHVVDRRAGVRVSVGGNSAQGELETMVAGVAWMRLDAPLIMRWSIAMRIMAQSWNNEPERASRPFSRDRCGFVIAEGAWFFVPCWNANVRWRGGAHLGRDRRLRFHL